ncbi:WcaI family glycosyltransferase [Mucilaginibacter xinganensis]|uniref:Colanic acid biosynthesis glycosyl transferase WcaI n=1 Tax=Mucilaginibacter xinganensis TaxID=1234841 RepID=A0A223P3L9_9SPHI|nr:WcaI family glycosyltransferase [Mucilaginibacter xinganensis]ASU36703.1 colanic acid biosynthesis glycosyl transferase WcaI [Mucilaginibacter xinganensis]
MTHPTEYPKNKTILLISHNFSPEPTGIGKYNGEMMNWLATNGYDCTIITTFPYYPYWKVQAPHTNRWFKKEVIKYEESNTSITIHRCPSYVPSNPTGKRRLIQDFSFWTSMFWKVLNLIITKQKFDLIITIAPPFHLAYLGLMLKKRNGSKLLYHIQDLQIEAAQDLNILSSKKFFDRIYRIEKNIIEKADYVSSISDGMIRKIKAKVDRETIFFPNWVDTSFFFPLPESDKLKSNWGYQPDDIIFLYSGAIGEKQGLESILLAAEGLMDNHRIKFIICGSGPYKEKLMETTQSKKLSNIKFFPIQDKELFNEFLNMADYHLVLQKANASDLVMPSKLTNILAIGGVCIATSSPGTSLYNLISEHDLGYITEPDNHSLLSKLISALKPDKSFQTKRNNALNYARQYLDINNVMNTFLTDVFV